MTSRPTAMRIFQIDIVSDQADFIIESRDGLLREGALRRPVRRPHHLRLPLQPALDVRGRHQHPAIPAGSPRRDADHRNHDEHPDARRAGGCRGPGGRRLDRGAGEHLPPSRHGRGSAHGGPARTGRGVGGHHLEHADHGCRLPAARIRRRPDQPVLPAVRPDRDVRAAGVAGRGPDGGSRPRLLPGAPASRSRRRGRGAETLHLGAALRSDHPGRPAQPMDVPRDGLWRTCPVRRLALPGAAPADRVHQLGLGEDPRRQRLAPARGHVGGRARRGYRGRGHHPGGRRGGGRPDERPAGG